MFYDVCNYHHCDLSPRVHSSVRCFNTKVQRTNFSIIRTRIQSFVVSEPGSVSLEHATEQELEQMDEDGEPILINVKDINERNSQEPENETKNQRETKEESLTPEVERTSVELNDKGTKD